MYCPGSHKLGMLEHEETIDTKRKLGYSETPVPAESAAGPTSGASAPAPSDRAAGTSANLNLLSKGQTIVPRTEEEAAALASNDVHCTLAPGEACLHSFLLAHRSGPNLLDYPRVGLAVRYMGGGVMRHTGGTCKKRYMGGGVMRHTGGTCKKRYMGGGVMQHTGGTCKKRYMGGGVMRHTGGPCKKTAEASKEYPEEHSEGEGEGDGHVASTCPEAATLVWDSGRVVGDPILHALAVAAGSIPTGGSGALGGAACDSDGSRGAAAAGAGSLSCGGADSSCEDTAGFASALASYSALHPRQREARQLAVLGRRILRAVRDGGVTSDGDDAMSETDAEAGVDLDEGRMHPADEARVLGAL